MGWYRKCLADGGWRTGGLMTSFTIGLNSFRVLLAINGRRINESGPVILTYMILVCAHFILKSIKYLVSLTFLIRLYDDS